MSPPDGLLTSGFHKRDVGEDPIIIAAAPFASDDCLDVFSPVYQFPPLEPEELNTMNPSEDEPSSGLNGRLRPRKSAIPLSIKLLGDKNDGKEAQDKLKRSSTPSKASPSKPDNLSNNSNLSPTPPLLCPYCNRKFGSKKTVSKHIRRLHLSISKSETSTIACLFCNHVETDPSDIIRHMIDSHPNQYFACLDCLTRFPSTKQLAEHKLNICEKLKISYGSKLRRKPTKKSQKPVDSQDKDDYSSHGFNGIVISYELKPGHIHDGSDIEDNITTNLILPPHKNISPSGVLDKNAVIVLDDIQCNRRIPSNFSFHNTDADQILSRLGVVHRSPKTGESTKKDWFKAIEDATQKFEKCFDTRFYSKVASNVQENLTKYLDGSFNFNPDPDSTIKTRKSKNSVVINTAEGFPILLASEQFSRITYDGFIPRTVAPKHKWKWDNLEYEKPWNPDQIKKDTHANNCIISLVSSLDIWTQLRMRSKFEDKFNITPVEKKTEKQHVIEKELKEILESREIPTSNSQIAKCVSTSLPFTDEQDFHTSLGLLPSTPKFNMEPAILSGECVRPRCYVCCACGAQSRDSRALNLHVSTKHPNAQVQHYEIVGESLLKADILKHLYVPPNHNVNRTRPPRGFRDCTKCMKSITIEDLHQHMLDCAGDTPAVRRKCRYRPFGVRRRRPRLPDNRIRKKIRNDIRTRPSRQKNRMRSKPKIRSEVGDAETIRKMIADLPAKRHRALVNPLNSILRPRRKLDKQRAMLMMKRHASEDLKNSRTRQSSSTLHFDHQQTTSNNDRYKSIIKRDDEDNEPLKSRLKRASSKITRPKDSLNRKAMLKRPKRKIRLLADKKDNEVVEKELDTSVSVPVDVQIDELSVDHNDKRVNVNGDPQNIREHSSGQGEANNGRRDNQRPSDSGQNANSRNVCAPAQNIPLKHSIARLTANSERHDKSVQFHHLFLVQQECNNTNEHVPTGERVLFENEAVVTKLDKPPLHFHQNDFIAMVHEHNPDSVQENNLESIQAQTLDSIQKNKLNKPRKGLNDCIAMLKNKLVDVDPNAPSHVSVQCGTDDLLSSDPVIISTAKLISPRVDVMNTVQALPSIEKSKICSSKNLPANDQLPKPSPLYHGQFYNHGMYGHVTNERQPVQWRPVNYDAIMPRYIDNRTRKETSCRRTASQHDNLFFAQQLLNVTPPIPNDDMLMHLSAEAYNAYNFPPRKSPKNFLEQFNVESNKIMNKYGKRKVYDKYPTEALNGSLQNCGKIINNQNKKSVDISKKSTRSRVSAPRKPKETLEKHVNIRKEVPKSTKSSNEKYGNKPFDCPIQRDLPVINIGDQITESYPPVIKRKRSSNVNTEVNVSQFKQTEHQLLTDLNSKMPVSVYTGHILNDIPVSIPVGHVGTNIEPALSVPIDLSSNALSINPDYSSTYDPTLLANYERYETLDLSNKRRAIMGHRSEDEVVDLRINHNLHYPPLSTLEPTRTSTSVQEQQSNLPLNFVHQNEYVPTDWSLNRKDEYTNVCINLSRKLNIDEAEIQDLSKNKTKTVSTIDPLLLDHELPTDLSNKNNMIVENITLTVKEPNKNDINITHEKCELIEQDMPNYLSEKVSNEKPNECNTNILTTDTQSLIAEEANNKTNEMINNADETAVTSDTNISCSTLSQIHTQIYDPTLRIPQYKIRPIETESTPGETNVTEPSLADISTCIENFETNVTGPSFTAITTCIESYETNVTGPSLTAITTCTENYETNVTGPSLMATTTCIENYLPHEILTTVTNSTCKTHSSTVMSSSMIASIEAQERMTYSFTKTIPNAAVTSVAGSIPTYSLFNRGISTPFATFESMRPVYASPSACISMSKIDVSTNSLLSIPSTTIVTTSPVYTLAGTTVIKPLNCVTLPNNGQSIPYPPPSSNYLTEKESQITNYTSPSSDNILEGTPSSKYLPEKEIEIITNYTSPISDNVLEGTPSSKYLPENGSEIITNYTSPSSGNILEGTYYDDNFLIRGAMFHFGRDHEITRRIFLLPRDIVAILRAMHLHLRNRLWGVLSHYLSSRSLPILSVQSTLFQNTVPLSVRRSREVAKMIDFTYNKVLSKIYMARQFNNKQQIPTEEIIPSVALPPSVPKTNNDKTASLRAVRIKAPSERLQLKIITNQMESWLYPDFPGVSSDNNYNNESHQLLQYDISPDVQMYEVTSTQSGRNKLIESELLYKTSQKPVCDIIKTSNCNLMLNEQYKGLPSQLCKSDGPVGSIPLDNSVINEQVKGLQSQLCKSDGPVGSIPLDNSVINEQVKGLQSQLCKSDRPVGSIPLDNSIICQEIKDHLTVKDNINKNNNNNIDSLIDRGLNKTEINIVAFSESKVQESEETSNLNRNESDDDSDDDITLAVIVKQKLQDQNKLKLPHFDHKINTFNSDIKTNEKSKSTNEQINQTDKIILPESLILKEVGETISNKTEVDLIVTDTDKANQNVKEPSLAITKLEQKPKDRSKQFKNKGKKNYSATSSEKRVKVQDTRESNVIEHETDQSNKRDDEFESFKNAYENTLKSNLKQQNTISTETVTVLPSGEDKTPDYLETTKNGSTVSKYISDVHQESKDNDGNEIKHTVLDVDCKVNNKTIRNLTQKVNILDSLSTEKIHSYNEPSIVEQPSVKQTCTAQDVNIYEALDDEDDNLPLNILSIPKDVTKTSGEDDIGLYLRRSKRGKSLFMEGNEQATMYPEIFLEQKVPLTKKQLIFSKLLLDEEKNLNISASLDDNQTVSEENSSCLQTISDQASEEKNKSVKRKKSSHSKRKSKKKKYVDNSKLIDSDDDVAKAFVKETSRSENYCVGKVYSVESHRTLNPDLSCKIGQSQNKFDADNSNELTSNSSKTTVKENKTTVSTIKRKNESLGKNYPEASIHSFKPKKSKLSDVNDILGTSHTETITIDKSNYNVPRVARRARSKSVVVKSTGSMLYDPYDIDLEDMGDETEPFRKQKSTLLRTSNKLFEENHLQTSTSENVVKTLPEINLNDVPIEAALSKDFKEIISDSDESSKSDVPLQKYVEERERRSQLCESGNKLIHQSIHFESPLNDDDDLKLSRKKSKKNKRSLAANENVQKEDKDDKEVSEEQRSEQFMESFGFFSERKPRKSNLLASKKISETFHLIANESDDLYLDVKERPSKKSSRSDSRKTVEDENNDKCYKPSDPPKLSTTCDKNLELRSATLYCHVCKQEFRRVDNLVRHQLSLFHTYKLLGIPIQLVSPPTADDFNYFVIYKEHIDRLKMEQKMKIKKHPRSKVQLPSLQQILVDVRKSVREQQLARRNLSRDQALFLDCCELLNDSNRRQIENRNISRPFHCCPNSYALASTNAKEYDPNSGLSLEFSRYEKCDPNSSNLPKKPIIHTSALQDGMDDFVPLSSTSKQSSSTDCYSQPSTSTSGQFDSSETCPRDPRPVVEEITDEKEDPKSDGDVDSITAQNILESEEVKNLENDLLSRLKESACKFQPLLSADNITPTNTDDNCPQAEVVESISVPKENTSKVKNTPESKEKKNLDIIENIDIFEDKFDKIKRKCRSQAAAAKLIQTAVEPSTSYRRRRKSDKKKGKRNSKKHNQNTVLTKGALKGYDSIKVSILTSEIDMSAIVPPVTTSSKKKKKRSSKKKRDRKKSILTRKLDTNGSKDSSHKNIDVYEFLDNEEPEFFELRPSTVMERFRNLNKKEMLSSSKITPNREDTVSNDSVSDGDDFVYMSDDYVCSDNETENSLMSCELGNVKGSTEVKKSFSPLKRKDVMEKNAVMGKIFKHNAVRCEKKSAKPKETTKPKANLDQLFDSLLEEEPNSSVLNDAESPRSDSFVPQKRRVFSPIVLSKYDLKTTINKDSTSKKNRSPSPALSSDSAVSKRISSFLSRQSSPRRLSTSRYDVISPFDYEASTSRRYDDSKTYDRNPKDYELPPTKKHDFISEQSNVIIDDDVVMSPECDKIIYNTYDKTPKDRTPSRRKEKRPDYETSYDFKANYYDDDAFSDDAGVARQRARRKCTVGKQNILAETWSSESELDGMPPRPNSAESVVMNVSRKRKGRKKEGQICGGRKGNKHVSVKKQDFESRVTSSNRSSGTNSGVAGLHRPSVGSSTYTQQLSLPGPSGIGPRLRPTTSFWADGDEEPEHVQQHGWIVGDSHKKLVTMLAHAKGRKRNNDDKVRLID